MIFIHYDPKRFSTPIDETLLGGSITFGLGSMRTELLPRLFVDTVTEDRTVDF